jgi:2-C-methyl-D-erythritol 4-phosphate cytidylyltransferase
VPIPPTGVILAAGGRRRRLAGRLPKALIPVAGLPLLFHSLRVFARLPFVREIVVVLPRRSIAPACRSLAEELLRHRVTLLVPGGARRQDSVHAGLRVLSSPLVLVHDAARPLVRAAAVRAVAAAAARHGGAVLAAPAVDTIKLADARGRVRLTPDRACVWHAQTPQGFRREVLLRAYRLNGRRRATDDAQLVERAGGKVVIVRSDESNFKVTTREDLARAAILLDRG